jgi:hypothetical protein
VALPPVTEFTEPIVSLLLEEVTILPLVKTSLFTVNEEFNCTVDPLATSTITPDETTPVPPTLTFCVPVEFNVHREIVFDDFIAAVDEVVIPPVTYQVTNAPVLLVPHTYN